MTKIETFSAERLEKAFAAIAQVLPRTFPQAAKQTYSLEKLAQALTKLREPLERAKRKGGLVNPWTRIVARSFDFSLEIAFLHC